MPPVSPAAAPVGVDSFIWLSLGPECRQSTLAYPSAAGEYLRPFLGCRGHLFVYLWCIPIGSLGQTVAWAPAFVFLEVSWDFYGSASMKHLLYPVLNMDGPGNCWLTQREKEESGRPWSMKL